MSKEEILEKLKEAKSNLSEALKIVIRSKGRTMLYYDIDDVIEMVNRIIEALREGEYEEEEEEEKEEEEEEEWF